MILKVDNKQVFASDAGKDFDKNKETIFLLHGSGLTHIVWSLTEQYLSNKNFNILAIDLPGHGKSDGPCLTSIEKIADWLENVRNEINVEKVSIIGRPIKESEISSDATIHIFSEGKKINSKPLVYNNKTGFYTGQFWASKSGKLNYNI